MNVGWRSLLKTGVVVAAIVLAFNVIVASAGGYLFLSDYEFNSGIYAEVWAYVEGYAELDEYGCLTGWIVNVYGSGGGSIKSPASGYIVVSTPPSVVYYEAETKTEAYAYVDGKVEYVKAVAVIVAPPGAC